MLLRTTACLSRVPKTSYRSPTSFKWATYTFWYVLDPIFRRHFRYSRRKAAVDRVLEKNSFFTNVAIGVLFGLAVYFTLLNHLLPTSAVGGTESSLQLDAQEVLDIMKCDTTKELATFQLLRVKRIILGKLHAVADLAEVRRQRKEVDHLQAKATREA